MISPAACSSSRRAPTAGTLNPDAEFHRYSLINSNGPSRGVPVLVVNIQSFYSNQFFLRPSIPFPSPLTARDPASDCPPPPPPPPLPPAPISFRQSRASPSRKEGRKEGTIQVSHEMDFRASEEGGGREKRRELCTTFTGGAAAGAIGARGRYRISRFSRRGPLAVNFGGTLRRTPR